MRNRVREWRLPKQSLANIPAVEECLRTLVMIENAVERDRHAIAFIGHDDVEMCAYLILETAQRRRAILQETGFSYERAAHCIELSQSLNLSFDQARCLMLKWAWEWLLDVGPAMVSDKLISADIFRVLSVYMLNNHVGQDSISTIQFAMRNRMSMFSKEKHAQNEAVNHDLLEHKNLPSLG